MHLHFFLLLTAGLIAQGIGCFFGYRMWQGLQGSDSGVYAQGDGGQRAPAFSGGGGTIAGLNAGRGDLESGSAAPQTGFVAFSGEGNKLGS